MKKSYIKKREANSSKNIILLAYNSLAVKYIKVYTLSLDYAMLQG